MAEQPLSRRDRPSASSSTTAPSAPTCSTRTSPRDDFGGPTSRAATRCSCSPGPTSSRELHAAFFEVGVDVVETDTFGAFAVPLGEYGIADQTHEINLDGGQHRPRGGRAVHDARPPGFVAGSIGPGTKFASLGQIRFADLRDAYEVAGRGLLEGGVDLLLIETQFDLLGLKAAMIGARRAMAAAGREVPLQAQVTIELTGRMLPGTEIARRAARHRRAAGPTSSASTAPPARPR